MATKSVIEIDVLDEKFKAFANLFEKYQDSLKKMPGDWQKVNASANQGSASLSKNLQQATKNQKDLNKALGDSNYGFRNAARITGDIAKNLASSAISIAKWVALGSIGGGFGLGALAGSASSVRRQAQGLGVSTGQLRSANVNLGKYIDPASTLSNIADIQGDLSRGQILTRLGGKQGQNPADMLADVIRNATQQFKAGGQTQQYAEAMGLTQVFTLEELRRLASLSEQELNETITQFKRDRELLNVDDASSRSWQEFFVQLKRSGNLIETSFIKNLTVLTPQLKDLSESVAKAIDGFLGSEEVKQKLKDLATYIGSDEFKQAAAQFMEGLKQLGQAITWVVSSIPDVTRGFTIFGQKVFGGKTEAPTSATTESAGSKIMGALNDLGVTNPEAIAGWIGGLRGESYNFNPKDVNPKSGAYGIAQWLGSRKTDLEKFAGKSYKDTSLDEQIAFMKYELRTTEKTALQQLLAAKTREQGVQANLTYERPFLSTATDSERAAELNRRLDYAKNINVQVSSTAGSDITAVAKGLPR
jgi:predicted nucleic acid-binding protein